MPAPNYALMSLVEGTTPGLDADGCIPSFAPKRRIVAKTAAYTCLPLDSGTIFTNTAAGGSVTFTLPAVATSTGFEYWFAFGALQAIVVTAPAGTLVALNNVAATSLTIGTEEGGVIIHAVCSGTKWYIGVACELITTTMTVG
jgi:hypothetical protein